MSENVIWTKEYLKQLIKDKLSDYMVVVVSNREPYIHKYQKEKIHWIEPASGVTTALNPVLQTTQGLWIAHGSGEADKMVVDKNDHVKVPPHKPSYELRRIWMSKAEESGYYYGFANETLWPLCHIVYTKPVFNEPDWNCYKLINERFAKAVVDEIGDRKAIVLLQDYHFTLVPKMIKEMNPNIKIAFFWHIPWPNPEVFRICPWRKEILEGMLGADLLGFHIHRHVDNFLDTINETLEAKVDKVHSQVVYGGNDTLVQPFPISVDYESISKTAKSGKIKRVIDRLKKEFDLKNVLIGFGLDRIDYTKGLLERYQAIDRFFEKYPEYRGKFVFLQAGVLSRIHLPQYKALNEELNNLVEKINWKYSSDHWVPIIMVRRHFTTEENIAFFRMADVAIVSSLHDGMNLVAKEYVSAAEPKKGILILSRFTGAARELSDAIQINPYEPDHFADAIKEALAMPKAEKAKRMNRMKDVISVNNIYRWAGKLLQTTLRLD